MVDYAFGSIHSTNVPRARQANHLRYRFFCRVPHAKIFRFANTPNQIYNYRRLIPDMRGVSRSSRTLGWDAVDAGHITRESESQGGLITRERSQRARRVMRPRTAKS